LKIMLHCTISGPGGFVIKAGLIIDRSLRT
jgi:hypothetical protein